MHFGCSFIRQQRFERLKTQTL